MATEEEDSDADTTTTKCNFEYLLVRGWCVPWVPGDSNGDTELAARLDDACEQRGGGPLRRCVSAEEQAAGAEWLEEVLIESAPRLLDIAVGNDDVDMFVAMRPWAETLRRAQLLNADACRSVWLDWTVRKGLGLTLSLCNPSAIHEEDVEMMNAAKAAFPAAEEKATVQEARHARPSLSSIFSVAVVTTLLLATVLRHR